MTKCRGGTNPLSISFTGKNKGWGEIDILELACKREDGSRQALQNQLNCELNEKEEDGENWVDYPKVLEKASHEPLTITFNKDVDLSPDNLVSIYVASDEAGRANRGTFFLFGATKQKERPPVCYCLLWHHNYSYISG